MALGQPRLPGPVLTYPAHHLPGDSCDQHPAYPAIPIQHTTYPVIPAATRPLPNCPAPFLHTTYPVIRYSGLQRGLYSHSACTRCNTVVRCATQRRDHCIRALYSARPPHRAPQHPTYPVIPGHPTHLTQSTRNPRLQHVCTIFTMSTSPPHTNPGAIVIPKIDQIRGPLPPPTYPVIHGLPGDWRR